MTTALASRAAPRRAVNLLVSTISQANVADCACIDTKFRSQPLRKRRRKLRINPNNHAASIG
jgi:hypothetical protein